MGYKDLVLDVDRLAQGLAGFLAPRADCLRVDVVPGPGGKGFDVAVRIDGTYVDREDADEVAEWFGDRLREALDR